MYCGRKFQWENIFGWLTDYGSLFYHSLTSLKCGFFTQYPIDWLRTLFDEGPSYHSKCWTSYSFLSNLKLFHVGNNQIYIVLLLKCNIPFRRLINFFNSPRNTFWGLNFSNSQAQFILPPFMKLKGLWTPEKNLSQ